VDFSRAKKNNFVKRECRNLGEGSFPEPFLLLLSAVRLFFICPYGSTPLGLGSQKPRSFVLAFFTVHVDGSVGCHIPDRRL